MYFFVLTRVYTSIHTYIVYINYRDSSVVVLVAPKTGRMKDSRLKLIFSYSTSSTIKSILMFFFNALSSGWVYFLILLVFNTRPQSLPQFRSG